MSHSVDGLENEQLTNFGLEEKKLDVAQKYFESSRGQFLRFLLQIDAFFEINCQLQFW